MAGSQFNCFHPQHSPSEHRPSVLKIFLAAFFVALCFFQSGYRCTGLVIELGAGLTLILRLLWLRETERRQTTRAATYARASQPSDSGM